MPRKYRLVLLRGSADPHEKDKHEGYRNNLIIDAGKTLSQNIFISFQAITYTWEVVRTEIEDEYKLVTKILEYVGISIRETEVTQFGMAQQQHEQPTFSMQQ